jgi:hypothetical protein
LSCETMVGGIRGFGAAFYFLIGDIFPNSGIAN